MKLSERQAQSVDPNMIAALGMLWWVASDLGRKPAVVTGMWRNAIAEKLLTCFKISAVGGFLLVGGG
jgi:hypothetical protein